MIDALHAITTRPTPAAIGPAPTVAPAFAVDSVQLGAPSLPAADLPSPTPAPAGALFWTEASAHGLIGTSSVPAGPLGGPLAETLSTQAKADLRALMHTLADRRVTIHRERAIHFSNADPFERLDPDAAADAVISSTSPRFSPRLLVQVEGEATLVPLRDLDGLHAVDALHGGADARSLAHPDLAAALREASDRGTSFVARGASGGPLQIPVYWAYELLSGRESWAGGVTWSGERASQALHDEQELLAYAFLETGANADALRHPDLARDIRTARDVGLSFLTRHREPKEMSAFEAYTALARSSPSGIGLGVAGIRLADCDDPAGFATARDRVQPWAAVYHDVLVPSGRDDLDLQTVMHHLRSVPPQRLDQTARFVLDIFEAVEKSERVSSYDVRERVDQTCAWLAERLPNLDQPDRKLAAALRYIRACGPDEARKAADFAWSELSRSHPARADYEEALAQFDSLVLSLHDVKAAKEALRVVSVPVGDASPDMRLECYDFLLSLHPHRKTDRWDSENDVRERASEAAADYLSVMAAAHRCGQPLPVLTDQFLLLHDALEKCHAADQTRTTFEFLENGLQAHTFGDASRESITARFLEELVKTGDAEQARVNVVSASSRQAGTVEREDEFVVIGGIRVPVRPSA